MRFDYTQGKKAKYIVSVHSWNVSDHYYCNCYKQAKELFDKLRENKEFKGRTVSVYDLKNDIQKNFAKIA